MVLTKVQETNGNTVKIRVRMTVRNARSIMYVRMMKSNAEKEI
jgi:hypothetical protein